ncbi:A/G-specific adenine glycosylase [Listeria fleischmannii FSL S10-1203]|uniref:A/G-specific adenine glycosylase n=1 Tax=Listeria fleischmannii FSL S10-1203 TaxID=1265822 RepID=W7CWN3_9LIST|nr:A/G-specific adenine glycosylase [Listeria fleischmannii FSL S10-1203]
MLSIIVLDKERVLVEQRQESGLLANLFQFPTVEVGANDNREMTKLAFFKKNTGLKWN